MNLCMRLCSEVGTLTPTHSRKRAREQFPLSPGNGGEGWGEGRCGTRLLSFIADQVRR